MITVAKQSVCIEKLTQWAVQNVKCSKLKQLHIGMKTLGLLHVTNPLHGGYISGLLYIANDTLQVSIVSLQLLLSVVQLVLQLVDLLTHFTIPY